MKSYIDPKEINDALIYAHKLRSEAFHKTFSETLNFLSELFTSYNPQIFFRR